MRCVFAGRVIRFRSLIAAAVGATLLSSLLFMPVAIDADSPPDASQPPKPFAKESGGIPTNVGPGLAQLVTAAGEDSLVRAADALAVPVVDNRVRVIVECSASDTDDVTGQLEGLDAIVEATIRGHIQCLASPDTVADIATIDTVRTVTLSPRSFECAVTEGLELLDADDWQAVGCDGTGVKIGILDGSFAGYEDLLGVELPDTVATRWAAGVDGPGDSPHGTACAEIVHDIAPGAELCFAAFNGSVDWHNAAQWLVEDQGVDIITCSMGWLGTGPRDGTSSICDCIDDAHDAAVLWAQAAGNSAQQHWRGKWTDADDNGWHEYQPGVEATSFYANEDEEVWVHLYWDDPWGASTNDYDLYITDGSDTVAYSAMVQGPDDYPDPVEWVSFPAPADGWYYVFVLEDDSQVTPTIEIFANYPLTYYVEAGSLCDNATTAACTTVGAVDWATPDDIEYYSSRGPTWDGRTKPDLVGPVWVTTATYGLEELGGTSAGPPHVAGAAALLKQANPSHDGSDLQSSLEASAVDLGTAGKDNAYGSGRVRMPEAPDAYDFGDAPDPTYPTLLATDGARHVIDPAYYLGTTVDADSDGQPDSTATGDDSDGNGDDEDGVAFVSAFVPGQDCTVAVTASTSGFLDAWVDFNDDGDWSDAGEQVCTSEALSAGINSLVFSVPSEASMDLYTIARFRFSSTGGLSYTGEAPNGEVEDYSVRELTLIEGDASMDGKTNIVDAMFIAQYTVGMRELCDMACICGDTNDDGKTNIVDAMHIAQYTVDPTCSGGVLFKPLWEEATDPMTLPPP